MGRSVIDRHMMIGDAQIRSALRSRLFTEHRDEPDTVLIEELGVCRGQARIDLAVVNGHLHGYEIKSERDSLRRLPAQIDFYARVLDRATLVVDGRRLENALAIVPAWWGVLRVDARSTGLVFAEARQGRFNPLRDARSLVELLWLDDAIELLEQRGAARGVRGKARQMVWDRICERLTIDEIAEAVRNHVRARKGSQFLRRPSLCGG